MAISYGFNLSYYASDILKKMSAILEDFGVEESKRNAAIQRTEAECRKEYLAWTRRQAEFVMAETSHVAPQRSGNLSSSLYMEPDGDDWSINVNDAKAPYVNIVLDGRGGIKPRRALMLNFLDSRYGWRPMSNLARVTGNNAAKYPHLGNLRTKHMIRKVGGAPAIDFPGEGMSKWQSEILPGQVESLRAEIISIVQKNGGRVTSTS